jgi:hypothetical protein
VGSGDFDLDDDEEVREEDLALDDDVDGAFDGSGDGARLQGDDLDVDIELDDEDDDEELDPVTTVDERGVLQYAEASGPSRRLRPPPLNNGATVSGSQPSKRKRSRKRAHSTADTGVHRKPNVSRRSKKF